jgi:hypothetical protein
MQVPVRVFFGRFQKYTPEPWSSEEADSCGVDLETAASKGLTLVVWGSASDPTTKETTQLPSGFFTDGVSRTLSITETISIQDSSMIEGIPVSIDDMEYGEFSDRTLWIFFYLDHLADTDKLDYQKVFFEPFIRSMDSKEIKDFRAIAADRAAKAFARIMKGDPEERLREVRQRIENEETQVANWQESILSARTRLDMMRREFDSIADSMTQPDEFWIKEWNVLAAHPKIVPDSLRIQERVLQYDTDELHITGNDGEDIPVGRFRVKIDLANARVKIRNTSNRREGRDHPHVSNENPCWGGYEAEVLRYMQNSQLSELVEFIFGYLQTYNSHDDWGRYIRLWRNQPQTV